MTSAPSRPSPWPALALLALALGLVAWGIQVLRRPAPPRQVAADVVGLLQGEPPAGFARVTAPLALSFPRDAGPHPDFQTEWWYFTGNLAEPAKGAGTGAQGDRFGFQLTFFRRALRPPAAASAPATPDSAWRAEQVYLAHFALTDVAGGRFHAAERLQRGALGLAGAQAEPFRVWVDDWSAAAAAGGTAARPRFRLRAADGAQALDLDLEPLKDRVRHGREGYSPKGPEPGNASMYLSFTRLAAAGTLTLTGRTRSVAGLAWMDHEWSTSALGADQTGWDWFSLQLDDGRELMLFQLRQRDGGIAPSSSGTLVEVDGRARPLGREAFALTVQRWWTSPRSGARYPAGWRLRLPAEGLDLRLEPQVADQELDVGLRYWEGTVAVTGRAGGQAVGGYGYAELTGYADGGR